MGRARTAVVRPLIASGVRCVRRDLTAKDANWHEWKRVFTGENEDNGGENAVLCALCFVEAPK
jgi:hypothetical protein